MIALSNRAMEMRIVISIFTFLLLAGGVDSSPAEKLYELVGKVTAGNGKPFPRVIPQIFLQGAVKPFMAQTSAGSGGGFKFKGLRAGPYTISVSVPRVGELRRTIEVGPSFADSKRRIHANIQFEPGIPVEKSHGVSAVELSIPDGARQEYQKAQDFLARSDIKSAVAALRNAIEIAPQFSVAWNHLGTIAYQSGQYAQAEEHFREALKQEPDAYFPLVNLGGALLSLQRFEESLAVNQRAVKIRPDDPLAHSQLGQSYFFMGQFEEAERSLNRAKILDRSHFSLPQLVLAEIYSRKQDASAVVGELQEFLTLHPDSQLAPKVRQVLERIRSQGLTPLVPNKPAPAPE